MGVSWHDIAFQPGDALAKEMSEAWSWVFPEPWKPIICSMVGGIFLQSEADVVYWLDTGTGLIEQVASNREEFEQIVRSSPALVEEWFLPGLVQVLHDAGKKPDAGQCYSFTVLPVFAEGKYDVHNMIVVPIREQFVGATAIHRQLHALPEGAAVRIKIVD